MARGELLTKRQLGTALISIPFTAASQGIDRTGVKIVSGKRLRLMRRGLLFAALIACYIGEDKLTLRCREIRLCHTVSSARVQFLPFMMVMLPVFRPFMPRVTLT